MSNDNSGNETPHREKNDRSETSESAQSVDSSPEKSYRLVQTPDAKFSKIGLDLVRETEKQEESTPIAVIVKVSKKDYVPPGIKVRAQISSHIFTAELRSSDFEQLEQDPGVVSVSASKRLQST